MATITVRSDGSKYDKQARIYALAGRGIKLMSVEIAFGASEDYATGGISADLKKNGLTEVIDAIPTFNDVGAVPAYDLTNEKILLYGQKPTESSTPSQKLTELANGRQDTRSKKVRLLVFGR